MGIGAYMAKPAHDKGDALLTFLMLLAIWWGVPLLLAFQAGVCWGSY